MTGEIFIDSGAFIALLDRDDHQHLQARLLFSKPPRHLSTSVLVIAETYGWFLRRFGEGTAQAVRGLLETLPGLILLDANVAHQEKVWRKLDRLRGSRLTYIDASSLVWIEERRIQAVWGTDHHLALEGAAVTPGPPLR